MKPLYLILISLCLWTVVSKEPLSCPTRGTFKQPIPADKLSGFRASPDSCEVFAVGTKSIYSFDSQRGSIQWSFSPSMSSQATIVSFEEPIPMSNDFSTLYTMIDHPHDTDCSQSCSELIAVSRDSSEPTLSWSHTKCAIDHSCTSPSVQSAFLVIPQMNVVVHFIASNSKDSLSTWSVVGADGSVLNSLESISGRLATNSKGSFVNLQGPDTFSARMTGYADGVDRVQIWKVSDSGVLSMVHEFTDNTDRFASASLLSHGSAVVLRDVEGHRIRGISISSGLEIWDSDDDALAEHMCAVPIASHSSTVLLVSWTANTNQTDTFVVVQSFDTETGRIMGQSSTVTVAGLVDPLVDSCRLISLDGDSRLIVQLADSAEFFAFSTDSAPKLVFHGQLVDPNLANLSNVLKLSIDNKQCNIFTISEEGWVAGFSSFSYPIKP